MAKKSNTQRVTMSLPVDLLKLVDLQAEQMRVDRYEVIRFALAHGLAALRIHYEMSQKPELYADDVRALMDGDSGASDRLTEKLDKGITESIEQQLNNE